jgi:glutathione S-transferase
MSDAVDPQEGAPRIMKLYGARTAANPRRVKVYLQEKGLEIEQVDFDPPYAQIRAADFLARNPAGRIPVLELDDGTWLPESDAIIEYLEELHPSPAMIGDTPLERAWVRAFNRMIQDLFVQFSAYLPHKYPGRIPGLAHYPQLVDALEPVIGRGLRNLDTRIGDNLFLAHSTRPTTADCHLYALISAAGKFNWEIPQEYARLRTWYQRFRERPSARV